MQPQLGIVEGFKLGLFLSLRTQFCESLNLMIMDLEYLTCNSRGQIHGLHLL